MQALEIEDVINNIMSWLDISDIIPCSRVNKLFYASICPKRHWIYDQVVKIKNLSKSKKQNNLDTLYQT